MRSVAGCSDRTGWWRHRITTGPGLCWRCWTERARGKPGVSPNPGFPQWLEGSVRGPWINTDRGGRAAAQPRRLVPRAQKVKYIYLLPSPGGSVTPQLWGSARGKGFAARELKGSSAVSHESLDTGMAPPARRCCEIPALIWFHPSPGTGDLLQDPRGEPPQVSFSQTPPPETPTSKSKKKGGRQKAALSINLFAIRGE